MDTLTKNIAIKKIKEFRRNLKVINEMIINDESLEVISGKLGEQWEYIHNLKSLLKAYSISKKINSGQIDEAISEASKFY